MKLPEFLFSLFLEYNPETVDIVKHAGLVMNRIMERGFWASMVWLQRTYSKDQIISFLEKKGSRTLSSRELNYWAFISGIPPEKRQKWLEQAREQSHVWRNRHSCWYIKRCSKEGSFHLGKGFGWYWLLLGGLNSTGASGGASSIDWFWLVCSSTWGSRNSI